MILVVCALPEELPSFAVGPNVRLLACGVGSVEAAVGTSRMLASEAFSVVINAGIAGAFRGSARIGEAVIVTQDTLADFGLEGNAPLTLPGGAALVESAHADRSFVTACSGLGLRTVHGLTVTQVTTTDATAARLRQRYGSAVESMEGFAVLRAAAVAGVPALEVRG
ncbi:MAG: futalosine hydrolase, partial [Candidatus Eremiobacteraeota bacterium]|nr:futalosine hydrolase [Candidatus Eremiobacteraeota bacterium]